MTPLSELEVLFFRANKRYLDPPAKHFVEGYPDNSIEYYKEHILDFYFRTYKEVVVAGILWTKTLFGATSVNDIFIKHIEIGRKKQWFNVQLVQTGNGVIIDDENYNPYINISYSYNSVTKIKFEIGFYRYACSNGLIRDFKELSKWVIKPKHLFDIPFWLNPCLLSLLTKRYEFQIKILRNTKINGKEIHHWIENNVSKWNIAIGVILKNIEKDGENAFALLNILTDSSSNFEHELREDYDFRVIGSNHLEEDVTSNSERANRQRKVGKFLETLVDEIIKVNQIKNFAIDINSPEFKINDENIELIDKLELKESYRLDIGTVKF
jgi:hypothetical protein